LLGLKLRRTKVTRKLLAVILGLIGSVLAAAPALADPLPLLCYPLRYWPYC
jgi:hypothetical protein